MRKIIHHALNVVMINAMLWLLLQMMEVVNQDIQEDIYLNVTTFAHVLHQISPCGGMVCAANTMPLKQTVQIKVAIDIPH